MTKSDDPRQIAAELARDRAALADSLVDLRSKISPKGLAEESAWQFRQGALQSAKTVGVSALSNPWVLAGAAGLGLAWLTMSRRGGTDAKADDPAWLQEAIAVDARAAELLHEIKAIEDQGLLSDDELAQARGDVSRASESDLRRALLRGLEGLAADERNAALAVREAKAAQRLARAVGAAPKPSSMGQSMLKGALAAGAAAAMAAVVQQRSGTQARAGLDEALIQELKATLDATLDRLGR